MFTFLQKKNNMAQTRYVVQWDEQPMHLSKVLSSLVESQTLVDLTLSCNSYNIKVHKCILAANSTYFRDHLMKDMSIDRVVMNGIKHIVLKSIIEFMYCGETSIPDENLDELINAAKFLNMRGITSIMTEKIEDLHSDQDFNLTSKPPLFFSKNDKKYAFKEKDTNYALFDNTGRRKHPHTKVTDEAHVALAKEEAASRFALEMLKKDMNNTSNVFVIDETCTEATVETNLTAQYENANNMMQIQEYLIQNGIKNDTSDLVSEPNNIDINNYVPKTKQSPRDERINELANVPMLYKPTGDGGFVNVSNQILESLSNPQAITYHVMPEDGNVDFQQYICNNFGQYSMQIETAQQEPSYEIVNDVPQETKKPLTFTQLVADTVSSEYDTYSEDNTIYDNMLTKNEGNVQYVATESETTKLVNDDIFVPNYTDNFGADLLDVRGKEVLIGNVVTPKKKRGRPPKRKLAERNNESCVSEEKSFKDESAVIVVENIEQNSDIAAMDMNNLFENNKENDNPDVMNQKIEDVKVDQNENRRQTRSSLKFH